MNLSDTMMVAAPASLPVPASYAEKAMASLMQLHGELMDEKERRVELFRRLMEKEQAIAELKMYVKLLEERAGITTKAPEPAPEPRVVSEPRVTPVAHHQMPPVPPRVGQRPEG
jgi:chromatin segregation and condensation protein Rec8/ScpA/Scc1 (kleisin family)